MATLVRNPFILTPYVPEEYFCDRVNETAQLCKHIINGRNVALFASRRLGKTGLIRHCFEQKVIKDNYYTFLVDIYSAGSLSEMTTLLAREVFSNKHVVGIREKLLEGLKSIRPTIGYNELTSSLSLSIGLSPNQGAGKTLEEILSVLETLDRPVVVCFDEFQKIRDFREDNVEAYLRGVFQKCRNICFIYTGSIGHSMNNIFKSPGKPFYNSAVMMTIGAIDRDVYLEFAKRMFLRHGKDVEDALAKKCYDYFSGVTWYVQLLMNEAFAQTDKGMMLGEADFDSIYSAIIAQQAFSYQELFARFSEKQRALLVGIASEGSEGAAVTSQAFISRYGLGSASSVQTACNALKKNYFVTDNGSLKQITDLIFRDWLRSNS